MDTRNGFRRVELTGNMLGIPNFTCTFDTDRMHCDSLVLLMLGYFSTSAPVDLVLKSIDRRIIYHDKDANNPNGHYAKLRDKQLLDLTGCDSFEDLTKLAQTKTYPDD